MTNEALLLVGRDAGHAREVVSTHAHRLRDRSIVDSVHVALYEEEPARELKETFRGIDADVVYVVPMFVAHTHETRDALPRALAYVPGEVRYCEPVGRNPAITDVVTERATEHAAPDGATSLVLVGFGSSSLPYQRQVTEYHASRIRERGDYGEVVTCYLLQNPAVECVRYNVSNERAVALPLFLAAGEMTEREIPTKLELDRGGMEYADPLGEHPRVTDALHAEVERRRTLAESDAAETGEPSLVADRQPVATDGEGL